MTTIDTLPPAPSRNQLPEVFIPAANTFVAALPTMVTQINTVAGEINTAATAAAGSATAAASSASGASTSASSSSTSATAASTSATNAASSATAAALSATNSASSATAAAGSATAAASSATAAASQAAALLATSTTTITPAIASRVFTTQSGKSFASGHFIMAVSSSDPNVFCHGQVTSYASTTLTIDVQSIGTSTSKSDWIISLSGNRGATGATGATGASGSLSTANAGGTVDAITATISGANTVDHQIVAVVSAGKSTISNPTFQLNSDTARTITTRGGETLAPGDVGPAGHVMILEYNNANSRWELLNPARTGSKYLHIRDEKTQGTHGGDAVSGKTFAARTLNTVVTNEITGASLASDTITLPAGTYRIEASAPAYGVDDHKIILYNVSDSALQLAGSSEHSGTGAQTRSFVRGKFTISSSKNFQIHHATETARGSGLGRQFSSGVEVYTTVEIWKD